MLVDKNQVIYLAGHNGMVGKAIGRALAAEGFKNVITRSHSELELLSHEAVCDFYAANKEIECVIIAAAKVGGIHANNTRPAEFIHDNLTIQNNLIHEAWQHGIKKLIFLGSSCIYPKLAKQPITEDQLLTGALEPTNEAYAIAKIAGIKMCESYNRQHGTDYRSLMPTNLYGPGDYFHPEYSHVIPALLQRFHKAATAGDKHVTIWGSGTPMRDFLHVDDMANACMQVLSIDADSYYAKVPRNNSHVNVGSGHEMSIKECAEAIADACAFKGDIQFDADKPDGMMRKILDISLAQSLGWKPRIDFKSGIRSTYQWFKENIENIRC